MTWKLSNRSKRRLEGVDADLVKVVELALTKSKYDFGITCGLRNLEEQSKLFIEGATQTMSSRHLANLKGESEAVDIVVYVNNKVTWDSKYYRAVAQAFFAAAIELGIQIEWGGLWKTLIDGPHFQLAGGSSCLNT